jgi:hypothetical protein
VAQSRCAMDLHARAEGDDVYVPGQSPTGIGIEYAPADRTMAKQTRQEPGPPMTLGNTRSLGVRSLAVLCTLCHHAAVLSAESCPDHVPVPTFGPRMVGQPLNHAEPWALSIALLNDTECVHAEDQRFEHRTHQR